MITVGMITLVAKNLQYLETVRINRSTVLTSVGNVMETARLVAEKVDNSKITKDSVQNAERAKDLLRKLAHSTEWMAKIGKFNESGEFNSAIDSYINFVQKVNTVKLENLETATNMFAKMAEFSASINGNFEELADVLNEKIVEVLDQLNTTLGETNDKIESLKDINYTIQQGGGSGWREGRTSSGFGGNGFDGFDKTKLGQILEELTTISTLLDNSSTTGGGTNQIRVTNA